LEDAGIASGGDGAEVAVDEASVRGAQVYVVEDVVELGAELIANALGELTFFEESHVRLEEAGASERVLADVAVGTDGVGLEVGGVEPLIDLGGARAVSREFRFADIGDRDVGAVRSDGGERIVIFREDGERESGLPVDDVAEAPAVDEAAADALDRGFWEGVVAGEAEDFGDVAGVGAVVERTAAGAGVGGEASGFTGGTKVVEGVRPGEVGLERKAVADSLFEFDLAGVVVAVDAGVDGVYEAEGGIGAAGLYVVIVFGRRAGDIDGGIELEEAGFLIAGAAEMAAVIAGELGAQEPVFAEAALKGEVVGEDHRLAEVAVEDLGEGDVLGESGGGAGGAGAELGGKGAGNAGGAVGVGEIGVGDVDDGSEGWDADDILKRYSVGRLVVVADAAAKAGFVVICEGVGEAEAGTYVAEVVVDGGLGTALVVIFAAEDEALWGVGITNGLRAGNVAADTTFAVGVGLEWIPAEAGVDGEALGGMPVVLHEEAVVAAGEVEVETSALGEAGDVTKQEVGDIVAGTGVVEEVLAVGLVGVAHGNEGATPFASYLDLVGAAEEGGDFAVGDNAAIPFAAGRLQADIEVSADFDVEGGGEVGGDGDLGPGLGDIEGRGRASGAGLAGIAEVAVEERLGGDVVDVYDADVFEAEGLGISGVGRKDVAGWRKDGGDNVLELEVVAAEVMLADVPVDLSQVLVGVLDGGRSTVFDSVCAVRGIVGERDVVEDVEGGGIERRRVDFVDVCGAAIGVELVGRGGVWVSEDFGAGTKEKIGEVAGALGRGGNLRDLGDGRVLASALVGAEEEELALEDGSADGSAELILLERIGAVGEVVLGVHCVVAKELEDVAVELVGA